MNKKNKKKYYCYLYRNICVEVNGPYTSNLKQNVMIMLPDIECYRKNDTGVRSMIDSFLMTYKPINNGIPF